jgi:hypothetical protein
MTAMLQSRSQGEWDKAYEAARQAVQQYPALTKYIEDVYGRPENFAGYTLRAIMGNLGKKGSTSAEQNHSSIVAHLGRGASWSLQEQIVRLIDCQDTQSRKKANALLDYEVKQCRLYRSDLPNPVHASDDESAKACLSKWAFEKLWRKSHKISLGFEVQSNVDGSSSVRKFGSSWGSPETVTIPLGQRCYCSSRIAFMQQCGHEYAVDKCFHVDKYDSRWLLPKVYKQQFQKPVDAVADNDDDDPGLGDQNVALDQDDGVYDEHSTETETVTDPANRHGPTESGPADSHSSVQSAFADWNNRTDFGQTDRSELNSKPPAATPMSYNDLKAC